MVIFKNCDQKIIDENPKFCKSKSYFQAQYMYFPLDMNAVFLTEQLITTIQKGNGKLCYLQSQVY